MLCPLVSVTSQPTNKPKKRKLPRISVTWLGSSTGIFLESQNKRFNLTSMRQSVTVLAKAMLRRVFVFKVTAILRAAAGSSRREIIMMQRTYHRNAKLERLGINLLLSNEFNLYRGVRSTRTRKVMNDRKRTVTIKNENRSVFRAVELFKTLE